MLKDIRLHTSTHLLTPRGRSTCSLPCFIFPNQKSVSCNQCLRDKQLRAISQRLIPTSREGHQTVTGGARREKLCTLDRDDVLMTHWLPVCQRLVLRDQNTFLNCCSIMKYPDPDERGQVCPLN